MENKKIKNATEGVVDGIPMKSKLEIMVYKTLKEYGMDPAYEPDTFILMQGFKPSIPYYTRDKKTKSLTLSQKKIIDWKYTPDFKVVVGDWTFYIEVKGMANDVYPYKRKMFLKLVEQMNNTSFIEVWTKKHVLTAIDIMKTYERDTGTNQDSTS